MDLLELCGDLQRRQVPDLRHVELDEQPTAEAEEEKYEEAEAAQMLLQRERGGQRSEEEGRVLQNGASHHYDGEDHPQDKETQPADGAGHDVGG